MSTFNLDEVLVIRGRPPGYARTLTPAGMAFIDAQIAKGTSASDIMILMGCRTTDDFGALLATAYPDD